VSWKRGSVQTRDVHHCERVFMAESIRAGEKNDILVRSFYYIYCNDD
jgi:hypothetical protein